MATRRYSGYVRIYLNWDDYADQYECHLRQDGFLPMVVTVRPPKVLEHAVDSPEGYDSAAHAALSFASNDYPDIGDRAQLTESGWHISRTKDHAFG